MTTAKREPTVVVGGGGKTGRRVAERLEAMGVPVRVASRSTAPRFDWDAPATWPAALRGARAAYVAYQPDLAVPGAAERVGALADLAVRSGVRRLVLLSGRGEAGALAGERAVQGSGAEWTILRATWFAQNFSEGFFHEQVLAGEVALPAGQVLEPFLDVDDLAEVAAAALTRDGHAGQVYELTGPRLLTFAGAVAEIGRATGRELRYVQVPVEAYAAALAGAGLPPEVVSLVVYLFTEVLDGRNARLADGVSRALGRPPRDFAEFARRAAETGAWGEARVAALHHVRT